MHDERSEVVKVEEESDVGFRRGRTEQCLGGEACCLREERPQASAREGAEG